jgi:two-component system, cell cycle sensor histidine kinase and response regulator CckA
MAGETVLLVDDEAFLRRLVRTVLEDHGYDVIEAAGPEEALELSRRYQGRIDLVLSDVVMPRMRGTELVPLLLARRPGMRVLFMSASPGGVSSQPEPLLMKPFTLDALERAVREALAQPRAA